jgi:hypothetical protein
VTWLQQEFHWLVDVLNAVATRLFELPMSFLLVGVLTAGAAVVLVLRRASGRARRVLSGHRLGWASGLFGLLVVLIVFDYRTRMLEREVRGLARRIAADAARASGAPSLGSTSTHAELGPRVRSVLAGAEVSVARQASGVDYAVITAEQPTDLVVHVAIVDLTEAGIRIELSSDLSTKTRLSDFCRKRHCVVGLNGEAGEDPTQAGRLGKWVGNLVVRGKPVLLKDDDQRPFLTFGKDNRARYVPAAVVDRRVTPEIYNAIWGRWDLIVGGNVSVSTTNPSAQRPRPRCAMGVDAGGQTLYLVTVDGYQRGYSEGTTLPELGALLKSIGVVDAMACDEGGSAAMYLGARGGLVSRPPPDSSSGGNERITYTHFGISSGHN